MSELIPSTNQWSNQDRDRENFRKSPQHGNNHPARAVVVENGIDDPIPVFITDSDGGTPIHRYDESSSSAGIEVTVATHTVPALKQWSVASVDLMCRMEGQGFVKVNGTKIASFRTGASRPRDRVDFTPRKILVASDVVTITFKARTGSPIVDVESLFQALESTI
jgi:hypothetical protein